MRTRFRTSRRAFRTTAVSAAGLTALVTFLAWVFLVLFGARHVPMWTGAVALVFFAFCSAAMVWRYLRGATVLAVRPDGLLDVRHDTQSVAWSDIRDITLAWREDEFSLAVRVWPTSRGSNFTIELTALDATVGEVVQAIGMHHPVRTPEAMPEGS